MRSGFTRVQALVLLVAAGLALGLLGGGGWLLWQSAQEQPPVAPQPSLPTRAPTVTLAALDTATLAAVSPTPAIAAITLEPTAPFDPLACLPADGPVSEARVADAAAGAVLLVELDGKRSEVRLIGVDPAGPAEQELALLRELAAGQTVRLFADGENADEQGRLRRYALAGQVFLNYELVRRGVALPALYPPGARCQEILLSGERLARQDGLGYWALQPAQPTLSAAAGTSVAPPCDCAQAYACADFKTRSAAQACYNACGDYRNTTLDPDHNGLACEELP